MTGTKPTQDPEKRRTQPANLLLVASALISVSEGALFIGLPFLVIHFGGTPQQVGLVGAVNKVLYVAGLLGARRVGKRFNLFASSAVGCIGLAVSALGISRSCDFAGVLFWSAGYGLATALFWPPVVGLLSRGLHSAALNRRLGRFNLAWSGGMLMGPWIGGLLFESGPAMPFCFAAVCNAGAALLVVVASGRSSPRQDAPIQSNKGAEPPPVAHMDGDHATYLRMARVALISGYMVIGVLRYQLPNLAVEMRISEATFGLIGTALSASLTAAFLWLGRYSNWHYRRFLLWASQLVLAGALLIPLGASHAWQLTICVLFAGQAIGLSYTSHLFYRTSQGDDRARGMAMHEVVLSIGFFVGAFGGGLVADLTDNRLVYPVIAAAILVGVAIQFGLWTARPGNPRRVEGPAGGRA